MLEVWFEDGTAKRYDMKRLFTRYPQLRALTDRNLFLSGKLKGGYGIVWNDELDVEAETIYDDGVPVKPSFNCYPHLSQAVLTARAEAGISQMQLAELTGISQADISRMERGLANPSVSTLNRVAKALGCQLQIEFIKGQEKLEY